MKELKHIKTFIFDNAVYFLEDKKGDKIILRIYYKDKTYGVEGKTDVVNKNFRKEIDILARSLLSRKSGINRANSIKI